MQKQSEIFFLNFIFKKLPSKKFTCFPNFLALEIAKALISHPLMDLSFKDFKLSKKYQIHILISNKCVLSFFKSRQ